MADLLEKQGRTTEIVVGACAVLAGIGGVGLGAWIWWSERSLGLATITVVIGGYSLVLARRLLTRRADRPVHLVSGTTLMLAGLYLSFGAIVPVVLQMWSLAGRLSGGLVLGLSMFWLGWQRRRAEENATSGDAT